MVADTKTTRKTFKPKTNRVKITCRKDSPESSCQPPTASPARIISLTQGQFAIVDADMYDYLSQWKWYTKKKKYTYYAVRNIGKSPNQRQVFMHHEILNCIIGKEVDHINNRGYDNRRINIRCCTHTQNNQNRHNTSPHHYKGISWNKDHKKWLVRIQHNGKAIHIGYYDNDIEAARAYDKNALELFGEFAYLNFPLASPCRSTRRPSFWSFLRRK